MKQTYFFLAYRAPKDGGLLADQEKTPVDVQSANAQSLDELRRLIPEIKREFEPAKLETAAGEINGLKASLLGFVAAQGWVLPAAGERAEDRRFDSYCRQ